MKHNFRSKPYNGVEEKPPTKYEELHHKCWCIGANREEHTWADPRCAFYSPKMLPPPRDSAPPENSGSGSPPPQMKINPQTSMFQNQDDWQKDKRPPCYCRGVTGEEFIDDNGGHKVGDRGCYVARTSIQGIPPAGKRLKTDNPAVGFPIKKPQQETLKFDPPVTAEHEMLCAAYNKAMYHNPRDCSEMLDGHAMSLKFIKHVVAELHLMGWVCQQEVPFGE